MKKIKKTAAKILEFKPRLSAKDTYISTTGTCQIVDAQVFSEAKILYEGLEKVYPGRYSFESVYRDLLEE